MYFGILSIIIVFISMCYSQNSAEKCHPVALIPGFDVKKVSGDWYTYEVSDMTKAKDCLMYNWKNTENGIQLKKSQKSMNGYKVKDLAVDQVAETSEFLLKQSAMSSKQAWITDTDYKNFANVYVCNPTSINKGYTMVWTRKKLPKDEIVEKAHKSLEKSGFETSKLQKIKHDGCTN